METEYLLQIVGTAGSVVAAVASVWALVEGRLARQPKANVTFFKSVVTDRLGKRTEYKVKAVNVGHVRIEIMKVGLKYKRENRWIFLGKEDTRAGGPFPCVLDIGSERTFDITGLADGMGPIDLECACIELAGGKKVAAETLV